MLIEVNGVNRVFQSGGEKVQALRDVTLTVEKGALTVLRGRSGSGKTTLMNIIGGLDRPQSGSVVFEGSEITRISESKRDKFRRKNVGFVFQSVALISQMSAYENVEFGLRVAGVPAKTRRARAEECLSFVGLSKRMQHKPQELSGGEQQRVAIARAIAHRPKIIFADEPTAELDSHMGLQVIRLFRDLVEKEGLTVLMTTHDPNMMELADHVYTLEDGIVVEELHDLQTNPGILQLADDMSASGVTGEFDEIAMYTMSDDEQDELVELAYDSPSGDSYFVAEELSGAEQYQDEKLYIDEPRVRPVAEIPAYQGFVDESSVESIYSANPGSLSSPWKRPDDEPDVQKKSNSLFYNSHSDESEDGDVI